MKVFASSKTTNSQGENIMSASLSSNLVLPFLLAALPFLVSMDLVGVAELTVSLICIIY